MIIMSRNVHLVDDSVSREVIFVEGAVKTDGSDVTRADKGADAGALLENNIMVTNINPEDDDSRDSNGISKLPLL